MSASSMLSRFQRGVAALKEDDGNKLAAAWGVAALAAIVPAIMVGGDGPVHSMRAMGFTPEKEHVTVMAPVASGVTDAAYGRFGAFVDQGYVSPSSAMPDGDDWSKVSFTGKEGVSSHLDLTDDMMARADLAAMQTRADMITMDYVANMTILLENQIFQEDFIRSHIERGREETISLVGQLSRGEIGRDDFVAGFEASANPEARLLVEQRGGASTGVTLSERNMPEGAVIELAKEGRDLSGVETVITGSGLYAPVGGDLSDPDTHKVVKTLRDVKDVLRAQIVQDPDFVDPDIARVTQQAERDAQNIFIQGSGDMQNIARNLRDDRTAILRDASESIGHVRMEMNESLEYLQKDLHEDIVSIFHDKIESRSAILENPSVAGERIEKSIEFLDERADLNMAEARARNQENVTLVRGDFTKNLGLVLDDTHDRFAEAEGQAKSDVERLIDQDIASLNMVSDQLSADIAMINEQEAGKLPIGTGQDAQRDVIKPYVESVLSRRGGIGIIAASMRKAGIEVSDTDAISGGSQPVAPITPEAPERSSHEVPSPDDEPKPY